MSVPREYIVLGLLGAYVAIPALYSMRPKPPVTVVPQTVPDPSSATGSRTPSAQIDPDVDFVGYVTAAYQEMVEAEQRPGAPDRAYDSP